MCFVNGSEERKKKKKVKRKSKERTGGRRGRKERKEEKGERKALKFKIKRDSFGHEKWSWEGFQVLGQRPLYNTPR